MIFFYVLVVGTVLFVCWAVGVHWIVWMFLALCVAPIVAGIQKGMREVEAKRLALRNSTLQSMIFNESQHFRCRSVRNL
jgi:hypothetical protein